MDKFLVNMAVIKVNWDSSEGDILDNYMPLVEHTLATSPNDTVSVEEFKERFRSVAEFAIPTGAIVTLLKKSEKKYKYIERQQGGVYKINRGCVKDSNLEVTRDVEQRKFHQLKSAFKAYCKNTFDIELDSSEVDGYFFEILFEISPLLFSSVSEIDNIHISSSERKKFMVGRFISNAIQEDQTSFDAIVSFVRGAMLTETFYYSHPSDIKGKMRQVQVFLDTSFLLRVLGYADKAFSTPCNELIDMLRGMSVKLKCFRQTYNEIHNILYAAAANLRRFGRLNGNRPGDVFDYFSETGCSVSDIELEIAKLEENLKKIGISVVDTPEYIDDYSIDETALSEAIDLAIPNQQADARNHDVDCLTAIHRMRHGKPQKYLESCEAIFITTNSGLARASTRFFNKEYGVSNAPVCMTDQVFTTLIWLKAVKKIPNLPKDRLVATCFAATLPSEKLWSKYVSEAEKLKSKGSIGEEDYAVLVHSLEARSRLMDLTFGEGEIIHGTLEQVLASAKEVYVSEVSKKLDKEKNRRREQEEKILNVSEKIGRSVKVAVLYVTLTVWFGVLMYGIVHTSPEDLSISNIFSLNSWLFLVLIIVTLLNIILGYRLKDMCDRLADRTSIFTRRFVEKIFLA